MPSPTVLAPLGPRLKGRSIDLLIIEYEEGKTLRELAKDVGVSHVHLARLLKANGAKMRSRSANTTKVNAAKQNFASVQAAHAVILYSYGAPVDEIAASLRRPASWVADQIRESGAAVQGAL